MDVTTTATVAGSAVVVVGALVATARYIGRPLRKLLRQNEEFREDWYGQAARPGRDRMPGVMERLAGLDERQERIASQLVTNGGSSLRDAINRIEDDQRSLRKQVEDSLRISVPAAATQVVVNPQPAPDHS